MIPAKRFQFLDQETNVSVSKITSKVNADIINSAQNALTQATASLDSIIESSVQQGLSEAKKAADEAKSLLPSSDLFDSIKDSVRDVKGLASKYTDLLGLPEKKLSEFLGGITDNSPAMSKSLNNILKQCRGRGMGYGLPGRPYSPSVDCGNGKVSIGNRKGTTAACNAASYGDLLNKLTGGNFSAIFSDYNKDLQKLMALAGAGYSMNMCGVFGALSGNLPKDLLSKAAGGLLSYLGKEGNVNAVLDIAKSTQGLYPLLHNPSALIDFTTNFVAPASTRHQDYVDLGERTLAGFSLLKDDWDASSLDGMISRAVAENPTEDLKKTFSYVSTNKAFGEDSLDIVPDSDMDFITSSFSFA